jgi:hypothetical protein
MTTFIHDNITSTWNIYISSQNNEICGREILELQSSRIRGAIEMKL